VLQCDGEARTQSITAIEEVRHGVAVCVVVCVEVCWGGQSIEIQED